MKILFSDNYKVRKIKVSNCLVFNRLTFGIIKFIIKFYVPQIRSLKYKSIKPLKKTVSSYSKYNQQFDIVEVNSKNGNFVRISL